MNFLPADFPFLRPLMLLGLVPTLLLVVVLLLLRQQESNWRRAIDPSLLPYLLENRQSARNNHPIHGLLILWTLLILALAGPTWEELPVPVQEREDALVIVQDLSFSMLANDLSPTRLVRAQRKLNDILNLRRQEGLTALVVYAGDAHTVTPLTDDVETIRTMVPVLNPDIMPVMGSSPVSGINRALELLDNANLPQAQILLITDGITRSDISAINAALGDRRHTLSVLGVGTTEGAPIPMGDGTFLRDGNNAIVIPRLERDILQELTSSVRGRYSDISVGLEDLNYLLDQSIFDQNDELLDTEESYDTWHDVGPWLLLLAMPLAVLAFRRGWLLGLALPLVLTPNPAQALSWEELWTRKDRQGAQVFAEEDYDEAARLFRDPAWRAAANYRLGNYEQALADLALLDDPEAHYNRGNALAHLNRLEEAILAYEQTLAQVPDHADALHNKAIVEEMLEQQQEDQQSQDQQGENQDQEQQSGEDQEEEQDEEQQDQEGEQDNAEDESGEEQDQDDQQDNEQQEEEQDSEDESEPQQQEEQQPSEGQQNDEQEQSTQQFLQRIEDNPGELLRNKFRYQTRQRLLEQLQNPDLSEQQPEQIW